MVLKVDGSEDKDLHKVISENGLAKHMDHFIRLAQFLRIKTTLFPPGQVRKKNATAQNQRIFVDRTQVFY